MLNRICVIPRATAFDISITQYLNSWALQIAIKKTRSQNSRQTENEYDWYGIV